jgi:histidinol-phosphate aminotransferase
MRRRSFIRGGLAAAAAPSLVWDGLLRPAPARGAGWDDPAVPVPLRDGLIRLTQNENPLGMPPGVLRAVRDAATEGHRYPRLGQQLLGALAARNGLDPATVMLGNGSTEILRVAVHAAVARGAVRMVLPDPTYEAVGRFATPWAADVVRIPLAPDHGHDLDAMRAAARSADGPVFIFVCNPNNPTGGTSPCDEVEAWIRDAPDHHFFLVDEAYYEFADTPGYRTLAPLAIARPNVVVSRTFSKIYGMAGLRLGYGIGEPATILRMQAFTSGLNVNHLAHAAGLAALEDDDYIRRSLASNDAALRIATTTLDELGLEWLPTQTNFVMHRVAGDLETYIGHMRDAGILVGRPFPPLLSWNRVSLGTPDDMAVWADTLRSFRHRGWA